MKKNVLKMLSLTCISAAFLISGRAQNIIYSESFTINTTYSSGSPQWNNWATFRSSLDTTSNKFVKVTMKGTYDVTGRSCTDPTLTRRIATLLKNGTGTAVSCGGYTWSAGTVGSGIEFSADGTLNSCINNGYSVRPHIGNTNWGGVNVYTCNNASQTLTVIFEKPSKPNEMGVGAFSSPDFCTNSQSLTAKISNYGTNYVDSFRVYWSVNNVLQPPLYITSHLKSGLDTNILLKSIFNFTNNTTYDFKMWTHRPNGLTDSVPGNDTLKYSVKFFGSPPAPTTTNFKQCGVGQPILSASTGINSDTIMWFKTPSGGSPFGMGKTILGPKISATTTFYAQAYRFAAKGKYNNGYVGNIVVSNNLGAYNGNYFDVVTTKPLNVDSITFRLRDNNPTTNYRLYYKTGTFNGFETNSGAWTQISFGTGRTFVSAGINFIKVSAKDILLSPSQTYGFYFTTDPSSGGGNDIFMKSSWPGGSNADISILGPGKYCYGLFGTNGFGNPYNIDCEFSYSQACINPSRSALVVTVKPRPTGADIVKGSTFDGQFRIGDPSTPDVTEAGKTVIYNMIPPSGETNANHNSSWIVNGVTAKTKYGKSLTSGTDFVWSPPSGSGPGTITMTGKTIYIDSLITFSINYSDLGPYFCDSTIKRSIIIAPTPRPNFKFPKSVCLGDVILFDNLTTIQSGNATYTWYFGNGDSSDLQSPTYEYKSPGVYNVKLIAKSFPWKILHDTTIQLEVGELPTTMFRVNNKCQGLPVTFQNQTVVANGALTYDWDFGDGSAHSTAINPSHLYSTPDGYKVTLKSTANGCVSTLVKNAYMFARPVANFAAPLAPVCAKSEFLMPNTSAITLGKQGAFWSFGDGSGSTSYDGLHSYNNPGTYAVKLLAVSEFDCKDSITKSVTIKPTPNPDFTGNQFCGKIPTIFTNKTVEALPNPVYIWTFSDNFTSSLKNVTRTWPFEGPFSARLKASYTNGCSSFIDKDFTVLIQPKADFNVQNICSGQTANFVNKSKGDKGGIQYNWDFGNSSSSTLLAPTVVYNPTATTTYTVTLVASYPGGCSDTSRKTITVSESPVCDFTSKDLGLKNVKFTPGNSSYVKYEWFFGDGGSSTSTSPNYQYEYTGNFNVTLRATNLAGCTCEVTKKASATTSISTVSNANGVRIYPNPNNGTFTVTNADNKGMKVEVFNVLGSKVLSKTSLEGSMVLNLDENAKGIYLVKVTIDGVTSITKITVTN